MRKRPMRVLVLGATGHAGQAIVRHALEHGHDVTAATTRADPQPLRGLGVNIVRVDPELRSLAELVAGHELLVDAAAPYFLELCLPGSVQWRSQVDAAVRRMQIVIDAARQSDATLAHVGTYGTVSRQDTSLAANGALWRRMVSPYYETKTAMELAIRSAAEHGLRAVIVNPVTFVGPWNFRPTWNFVPAILAGSMPMVVDQVVCVIDVRDVACAIDLAMSQEYFGRPIPLAGHNIHARDLVVQTARLAGVPSMPPMAMPGPLAAAGAYWTHLAFSAFGLKSPDVLGLIAVTPELMPVNPSREQIALGVPIRPLEESLRDAVAFHQGQLVI
jgi:dihydroflavonol-4-reductase